MPNTHPKVKKKEIRPPEVKESEAITQDIEKEAHKPMESMIYKV